MKKLGELKFTFGTVTGGDIAEIKEKNVTLDTERFSAAGSRLTFATNIREFISVQGYPSTNFALGRTVVTGTTFGAFVLLHELGHRAKIYGKYDKDSNNSLATAANNEKIRAACFGELAPN